MDFKKAFDQTVREFKREVNKVLKVPEIEQKVLDVTSNEPWGPHGTVMSDIAQATRNYNDYQMIMTVIWKRINDTGRNWRHVYKALTLLEFLVAHGSERVIDELREHAYQLSTLADFQYLDSTGRDQGLNVRKKSQLLVALVNDKEKIREARQKATENRDKYRGVSSTGGMYKPSSYNSTGGSYGGDRYEEDSYGSNSRHGSREDDRYGRDRDADRYSDEDRYGRDWDRNGRDSDRSGSGDRYKDENGRDYDREEDRYNSRRGDDRQSDKYRSYDRDCDRAYDDDERNSSRNGGGRGDDYGTDDRRADRKSVDPRMTTAPPSYEEALGSPDYRADEQRDGGGLAAAAARASKLNASLVNNVPKASPSQSPSDDFDEFDPRASSATSEPTFQVDQTFGHAEQGGALRGLLPGPATSLSTALSSSSSDLFGDSGTYGLPPAAAVLQELDGDAFGDSPFKAETPVLTSATIASAPANTTLSTGNGGVATFRMSTNSFGAYAPATSALSSPPLPAVMMSTNNFSAYAAVPPPAPSQLMPAPSISSQPVPATFGSGDLFGEDSFTAAFGANLNAPPTASSFNTSVASQASQIQATTSLSSNGAPLGVTSFNTSMAPQMNQNLLAPTPASQPLYSVANQGQKANPYPAPKPQQENKFETKSSVWADTLSKGLVDLNIAGPKSNPLADIGIDFDLLRTERIKEERATAKTSTVTMGKAMGSGSGLGLAGAGAIAPPVTPVLMSNVGWSPGMGMISPIGRGMPPPMGPGMGMGNPMMQMSLNPGLPSGGMGPGMGMGMGMGMGPGMGMGMGMRNQQQYSGFR